MTREEFQELVDEVTGGEIIYANKAWNSPRSIGPTKVLVSKWTTGGAHGGSCWGGEPSDYLSDGEPEPEFSALDDILLKIVPAISFLQYKKLAQKIVTDTHCEGEYYGNYTNYATKSLTVDDLWDFLVENDLVGEQ